jgi:hypothetical protein
MTVDEVTSDSAVESVLDLVKDELGLEVLQILTSSLASGLDSNDVSTNESLTIPSDAALKFTLDSLGRLVSR